MSGFVLKIISSAIHHFWFMQFFAPATLSKVCGWNHTKDGGGDQATARVTLGVLYQRPLGPQRTTQGVGEADFSGPRYIPLISQGTWNTWRLPPLKPQLCSLNPAREQTEGLSWHPPTSVDMAIHEAALTAGLCTWTHPLTSAQIPCTSERTQAATRPSWQTQR